MPSSPDPVHVLLRGFASVAWCTPLLRIYAFRSTWPYLIIKVLVTSESNFLDHLVTVWCNQQHLFCKKCFWLLPQFKLVKYKFLNEKILHIFLCGFPITQTEAMPNVLAITNYQPQQVPIMSWTALVKSYMCCNLENIEILQNFLASLVFLKMFAFFLDIKYIDLISMQKWCDTFVDRSSLSSSSSNIILKAKFSMIDMWQHETQLQWD